MRHGLWVLLAIGVAALGLTCAPRHDHVEDPKKDETLPPIPAELKERLEITLEQVRRRQLEPSHGFWTIFHAILGMGLDTELVVDREKGLREKAIDYIARGGDMPGLTHSAHGPDPHFIDKGEHGVDVVYVAFGKGTESFSQGHQDQYIAEMAQWGLSKDKVFVVEGKNRTFMDFCKYSRLRASTNKKGQKQELTWAIIIIAQFYGTGNEPWKNTRGEELRFEDVVRFELEEPIEDGAACGGTHRLFGLTWAYHLHRKNGGAKTGIWKDVADKIEKYKKRARETQNLDGSFSNNYFKDKALTLEPNPRISTTGHTLEWLTLAMTDKELREKWVQESVMALCKTVLEQPLSKGLEGGGLYHAVHGLNLYHARLFGGPSDPRLVPVPLPPKD